MDELVRFCLKELAFDGDLGSNVTRLRTFVQEFHADRPQVVDDSYQAFVWSLIVHQPTVRIGILPHGADADVYVPPQPRAGKKKKDAVDPPDEPTPVVLQLIPDAPLTPLPDLLSRYGDNLRIAVDPETSFAAITGSHARPSKLSPMVYAALQLITRKREEGLSVTDLGRATQYDQKACFYLVKQLLDLNLIVKLRRGGNSQNFCIHRHFFERSPVWLQIKAEEAKAVEKAADNEKDQDELADDEQQTDRLRFDPIDSRHLSSMPLLRSRILKLLQNSRNNMHVYHNIILAIGFHNPTRTDRRFFITRLRELLTEGVIEKVSVLSNKKKGNRTLCLRLVNPENNASSSVEAPIIEADDAGDKEEEEADDVEEIPESGLKVNVTLHKQMVNHLEAAGTAGLTLNDLSAKLGSFDKRTLELLLSRLEKYPPPPHLADLGLVQVMETSGRERRYRIFTLAAYRRLVLQEGLEEHAGPHVMDVDFSQVGGFARIDPADFFRDLEELYYIEDHFKSQWGQASKNKKAAKDKDKKAEKEKDKGKGKKRQLDDGDEEDALEEEAPVKKKARSHHKVRVVPPPDFVRTVKTPPPTIPKKRGRPPKKKPVEVTAVEGDAEQAGTGGGEDVGEGPSVSVEKSPPRKRGRPPKRKPPKGKGAQDAHVQEDAADGGAGPSEPPSPEKPRKRGRPRKKPVQEEDVEDVVAESTAQEEQDAAGPSNVGASDSIAVALPRRSTRKGLPADGNVSQGSKVHVTVIPSTISKKSRNAPSISSNEHETAPTQPVASQNSRAVEETRARSNAVSEATGLPPTSELDLELGLENIDPSIGADLNAIEVEREDGALDEVVGQQQPEVADENMSGGPPAALEETTEIGNVAGTSTWDSNIDPQLQSADARTPVETTPASPSKPQIRDIKRSKPNISHVRRENELYRIIEEAGGIVNTSFREFREAHTALLEKIISAGEVASAPIGTFLDRRTLDTALNNLESRGRIKLVSTMAALATGSLRPAKIAYVVDLDEETVNTFLAKLGSRNPNHLPPKPVPQITTPVVYDAHVKRTKPLLPLLALAQDNPTVDGETWGRNADRAEQLFQSSDEVIHNILMMEKQTLAQSYGFIVGKMARVRKFHLLTLRLFESGAPSSQYLVSRAQRVICLDYYVNDLPLSDFTALVSTTEEVPGLRDALQQEESKKTPVGKLPESLKHGLQIRRTRSLYKFLQLFEILTSLKLVTALTASTSAEPYLQLESENDFPSAYDSASMEGWSCATAPTYYVFNAVAPIYNWAASETPPPFLADLPASTQAEAAIFWDKLEQACRSKLSTDLWGQSSEGSATGPYSYSQAILGTLRRQVSWEASFMLTWHQCRYLMRFVELVDENCPLSETERVAKIQHLSEVAAAPVDAVMAYLTGERQKHRTAAGTMMSTREARKAFRLQRKAVLGRKATDIKRLREQEWEGLIEGIPRLPSGRSAKKRLKQIRKQFLADVSGKDLDHWRRDILTVENEKEKFKHVMKVAVAVPPVIQEESLPPLVIVPANPLEKSVHQLIKEQGESVSTPKTRTSKRANDEKAASPVDNPDVEEHNKGNVVKKRRARFQWNADYDELARDCSAIIRSRCSSHSRMDWSALDQVFPAVPRNGIRQRIARLRDEPAAEAYMDRLQEAWNNLWVTYRGSSLLPDDEPRHPSKFDLVQHIQFLRKHIDKNALRVGFTITQRDAVALPASIEQLHEQWLVTENEQTAVTWEPFWIPSNDDAREKTLLREAFTREFELPARPGQLSAPEGNDIAESVVKMTFGTPNELYDPMRASELLTGVGADAVGLATQTLLSNNVLSKLVRDPAREAPGRRLKISEANMAALTGPLSQDTFQDALQLEESYYLQRDQWCEWSLLSTDGDSAAFLQWVSDHEVDTQYDTSIADVMRDKLDWNSKKADDDDMELGIMFRLSNVMSGDSDPAEELAAQQDAMDVANPIESESSCHGQTSRGALACCRQTSSGLIDCSACLQSSQQSFLQVVEPTQHSSVVRFLTALVDAGPAGLSKDAAVECFGAGVLENDCMSLTREMCTLEVPLAFWSGYMTPVLVSSNFADEWSIKVALSGSSFAKIEPRRWLDISGQRVNEVWSAALKAVMGMVWQRPGISQVDLLRKFKNVYDRQEIYDLLKHLQLEGYVKPRLASKLQSRQATIIEWTAEEEEQNLFWFAQGKHWYKIA